jgi:hypothetical protein
MKSTLLEAEQQYLDTFKPRYHINQKAESRLGSSQTPETRAKISSSRKCTFLGSNNPMFVQCLRMRKQFLSIL